MAVEVIVKYAEMKLLLQKWFVFCETLLKDIMKSMLHEAQRYASKKQLQNVSLHVQKFHLDVFLEYCASVNKNISTHYYGISNVIYVVRYVKNAIILVNFNFCSMVF